MSQLSSISARAEQHHQRFFRKNGFGPGWIYCGVPWGFYLFSRLADMASFFLGMSSLQKSVRLFFIYASFTTIVGGFIIYLTLAFWLKLKDLVYTNRNSVFDL